MDNLINLGYHSLLAGGRLPDGWETKGLFPDLKQGSLGSCAVVATGDNLLKPPSRANEIDAHDTVFRYNAPIAKYRFVCTAEVGGARCDLLHKCLY